MKYDKSHYEPEHLEHYEKFTRFVDDLFDVAVILKQQGLTKYFDLKHYIAMGSKIVLDSESFTDFKKKPKLLHTLFPELSFVHLHMWSPFENKVVIERLYKIGDVHIAIWYECTIDKIPKSLMKKGCEFQKVIREHYKLSCSR